MRSRLFVLSLVGVTACGWFDTPKRALWTAQEAYEAGDVATFEEVVDLEGVLSSGLAGCMELTELETYVDDQFREESAWEDLGKGLGEVMVSAMGDKMVSTVAATVRNDFGTLDGGGVRAAMAGCGGLIVEDLEAMRIERAGKTARAHFPATVGTRNVPTEVRLRLVDDDALGWRVVGVELASAIEAYQAHQEEEVQGRLADLRKRLSAGLDAEAYKLLHRYAAQHGDGAITELLKERAAMFEGAPTPLVVEKATRWRGDWGISYYASATVRNPTQRTAAEHTVRFRFYDGSGTPVESSFDKALLGRNDDPLPSGASETGTWDLNRFSWPVTKIRKAEGVVVRVQWEDGEEWLHPALVAGIW